MRPRPRLGCQLTSTLLGLVLSASLASAQAPGDAPAALTLTLAEALRYAEAHYPSVRAAMDDVAVATAGVDVARAGYLPRLDSMWQSIRATANNVVGQVLPQSIVPALTGPVAASASSRSVWGSTTGALLTWEPFDFGLRGAAVASAEAGVAHARAGESLARLDVQAAVATAFLDVVVAERGRAAAQADVERREILARVARTLAANELRAGADASRAEAERAAAATRVIKATQALTLARIALSRLLGLTQGLAAVEASAVLAAAAPPAASTPAAHPLVEFRTASVELARAQEGVLARTDLPRVFLQSSVFARGSGARADGDVLGGANGLGLDRANWAAGIQIVLPNLFDFSSLRARRAASAAVTHAERARLDEAVLLVDSRRQAAAAMVEAARAIAANTPVVLAAAADSETQSRARYQAGLATLAEVADAQSLLAQAEFERDAARVELWRARLAEAVAMGDLSSFLAEASRVPEEH